MQMQELGLFAYSEYRVNNTRVAVVCAVTYCRQYYKTLQDAFGSLSTSFLTSSRATNKRQEIRDEKGSQSFVGISAVLARLNPQRGHR